MKVYLYNARRTDGDTGVTNPVNVLESSLHSFIFDFNSWSP